VFVAILFAYAHLANRATLSTRSFFERSVWYGIGGVVPVALLWFYQWRAFGNPFLPGQHWMPPVEWIELGYQGYGVPRPDLLAMLLFDHRFGLFAFCPLFLLALFAPWRRKDAESRLPEPELWMCLGTAAALWIFFGGSNYTQLQYNTGLRYLAPIVPFLFVPAAVVLTRLPRLVAALAGVASVWLAWSLAMYREVERPLGVLDAVVRTMVDGLRLPVLESLERTGGAYGGLGAEGTSAAGPLLLAATLILVIWWVRPRDA